MMSADSRRLFLLLSSITIAPFPDWQNQGMQGFPIYPALLQRCARGNLSLPITTSIHARRAITFLKYTTQIIASAYLAQFFVPL
jgi:hypothetical protein